jgi:PleD family two-component response regulator
MDYVLKKEVRETFISNGGDAVDQIGTIQPDLIITDMIPYKSGLEITAYSKKTILLFLLLSFLPRQRRLDRD